MRPAGSPSALFPGQFAELVGNRLAGAFDDLADQWAEQHAGHGSNQLRRVVPKPLKRPADATGIGSLGDYRALKLSGLRQGRLAPVGRGLLGNRGPQADEDRTQVGGLLRRAADDIVKIRNEKFPPTMRCAGSIFKNFLIAGLPSDVAAQVPELVVREGKIPAAWFLEQIGAKGMTRGDIQVASYHANLVYNRGAGTAADLCALIDELKARVRDRFGIQAEEEVQYVGF